MASISKLSRDKRKKNSPYYIRFKDHEGKRRAVKVCSDKGVTQAKAAKIETLVERIKIGLADPSELESLLGKAAANGLERHLKAFETSLRRKGNTDKHVRLTMSRVRAVIDGCGFESVGDVRSDDVERFVSSFCEEEDRGHRTYNHYLQALDSFGNWLAHPSRRIAERNPFAGISRRNAATDVRHQRRALTAAEVAMLIDTARQSDYSVQCYDGPTRARIYLLSYMTGLRKSELASLTPASFDLDGERPTVTVEAAASKHRRRDTLPLHSELVSVVREWLAGLPEGEPLFPKLAKRKAYAMIRRDLEEAGIPYETEEGVADFHAAGRHSHITELLRSGVKLVEARELARHSDVRTTMKYTHIGLDDQSKAVNKLPSPKRPAEVAGGECLHIARASGVVAGQSGADAVSGRQSSKPKEKRRSPSKQRVSASSVSEGQPPFEGGEEWRRRESNPRPAIAPRQHLRV